MTTSYTDACVIATAWGPSPLWTATWAIMREMIRTTMPDVATGADLDALAAFVGVQREEPAS